jgi:nicotinate dehydrogenase subunit B
VCRREYQAVRALEALRLAAKWSEAEGLPDIGDWGPWLRSQPSTDDETETGQRLPASAAAIPVSARYSRPLIAHASIGPSCGLAQYKDDKLTVWSHTQGVYPLKAALAKALNLEASAVHVIHAQGAGCYGHNGADDAATDAAILALALSPRPVRVQWMRDDELAWSPYGAPMSATMNGAVTADGRIADWTMDIWSGPQTGRPGFMGHPNLMPPAYLAEPVPLTTSRENPMMFMAGDRNAQALYDLPRQRIVYHKVHVPFRTSSLRSLGGYANVFAIECFMDELARAANVDPVGFRLAHLSDPRARAVIEKVAAMADWKSGGETTRGIAFSRYKNSAAYAAIVVEVEIGEDIRVPRVWCAIDAGLLINPDGAANQIEGGIVQSVSWTLKEQVTFDHTTVTSRSWDSYPILRFGEVPDITVGFLREPGRPPLGVGEASQGPTAAALANAAARALGVRVRDLPISRERLLAAP